MSQELNIEVQISSVEQITSGITTITPESIGAVPLGQSGKIPASYLPDQASLDTEVDSKIVNFVKNTDGGTNTDKLVTFSQAGGNQNVVLSGITNDGDGYIAGIMGWGNPSGTQWSDLNGTYVKTSVAVSPSANNNNGMHTPEAGTFNYYLQNPISMGSPNSNWNGIAYFLAPMNRSGWGDPDNNNLTDPPVNYWRLCVGADWPYTYFTNPSTNPQVFPTSGWIPVSADAPSPNEGEGGNGADYLATYGGGFSVALGGGTNSEIGAWGFGVEDGGGKSASLEPTGVILDNGAKLRKGTTDAQLGGYKGIALECSAQYELKWEAGRLYTMQQDGFTIRSVEHCMSAPTANDDTSSGYAVGTRWVMDSGAEYLCTDSTNASAVWQLKTYATLENGKVPSNQLPSYVDDVLEYADNSAFPTSGESGNIYVSLATNKTFRWSGSAYIEISPSEVTSVNTKTGAVTLTASDVGACASNDSRLSDNRNPNAHYHGDVWDNGSLQAGAIIALEININSLANGTYPVLQQLSSIFPNINNSSAQVQVSGTSPNKTLTILNGGVGYHASQGNKAITIGGVAGTISGWNSNNKPVITNNHGFISAGSFGTTANSFCEGDDARLSNNRTPTSHAHGNITNAGAVGTTANLPLITTTSGVVTTGSFGTTANTFAQGNDSRLSDNRTPTSHTHPSSEISDSTSFGRTLLTASTAQAQRTHLSIFVTELDLATIQAIHPTGNFQRVYIAQDTGKAYVWSGSVYTEVSPNTHTRSGISNVACGETALTTITTGKNNTAIGSNALKANNGDCNVAVGNESLEENTTGKYNVSVGDASLRDNKTGDYNSGVGGYALGKNVTGFSNTAVGYKALETGTGLIANTAVGEQALKACTSFNNTAVGQGSMYQLNSGNSNSALGLNAGASLTFGSKNTLLGTQADVDIQNRNNSVVIGANAISAPADGSLSIGGTGGNVMTSLTTTFAPTGATGTWLRIWLNGLEYRIPIQRAS